MNIFYLLCSHVLDVQVLCIRYCSTPTFEYMKQEKVSRGQQVKYITLSKSNYIALRRVEVRTSHDRILRIDDVI